jgi:hypothetical protein
VSQAQVVYDAAKYAVWFTFLASVAFPVVTALFWPWWKSAWGWNIVTLEICIALALLFPWLSTFGVYVSGNYAAEWADVASVALIGFIVAWRTVMIWRAQRNRDPDDPVVTSAVRHVPPVLPGE